MHCGLEKGPAADARRENNNANISPESIALVLWNWAGLTVRLVHIIHNNKEVLGLFLIRMPFRLPVTLL